MRLSGLASGMDIDSMVQELMKARRTTYNNMVKDRTKIEWQREDYRSMSSKIVDFRNNKLASFNLSNAINAKKTEVSGDSSAIVINATNSIAAGSLSIKIDQLATTENRVYSFTSGSLESQGFALDGNNVTFQINGQSISLSKDATMSDLAKAINAKSNTLKATALYNSDTGQFSLSATQTGTGKLTISGDNGVFNLGINSKAYTMANQTLEQLGYTPDASDNVTVMINGESLVLNKDTDLDGLVTAINTDSNRLKVTASYNAGVFSVESLQPGGQVELTDSVFMSNHTSTIQSGVVTEGSKAKAVINGITYEQDSNRFALNGFDFTLKAKSASGSTTTITAEQDTSKIIDTIKSFVTEYNNLIGSINSELAEANNRTYKPLTSEEKKEMSDKEIELWEEKARSGTLRNDSTLMKLVSDLRLTTTALLESIPDGNGGLLSIGITTGSYTEKGKLVLDEEKLSKAIDANPDAITKLFINSTTGIFRKMSNSTMTALKELSDKAGTSLTSTELTGTFKEDSVLGRQLRQMKLREDSLTDRLNRMETQYYKQFTAMETAMNRFNSQAGMLSSFMSN